MKKRYADRIVGKLRNEGLKVTPQRIAILTFLDGNKSHPSVDEIHREVSRAFPTISLATVYNTLETLEKLGEVQSLSIDPSRKRFDPEMSAHHHVRCERCGTIRDVHADLGATVPVPDDVAREFVVERASVSFRGHCRECVSPH
jgi:Fur family peroxide stress response transcriptional regulator